VERARSLTTDIRREPLPYFAEGAYVPALMAAVARGVINQGWVRVSNAEGTKEPAMTQSTETQDDVERLRLTRSGLLRGAAVSVVALSASGGAALSSSRARAAPLLTTRRV